MIVTKEIKFSKLMQMVGFHVIWLTIGASIIAFAYDYNHINFMIPWLPLSVIGTAVAFYVGFKNNSAYDRMWEARKIWGAIVNTSRAWGMYVDGYVTNIHADKSVSETELYEIKKRLIYRHIAWLYALRSQLLIPTSWEHVSQGGFIGKTAKYFRKQFGVGLVDDKVTKIELHTYLPDEEYDRLINNINTATQIINEQSRDIAQLRKQQLINDFSHVELEKVLYDFYDHQGKCERIKKFPLPRQYAYMSRIFVGIFILLLPFSMIPEMMKLGNWGYWLSVPLTVLIGWVYIVMEHIGDYSENPFQGMVHDIPMLSLCRTIEIDLREMLGETNLPPNIEAVNGVLM